MLKKVATELCSELGHDTPCTITALKFSEDECCHRNMVMDGTLLKEAERATYICNSYRVHSSSKSD